jgi:DNA-binding transcriptional LysR family regulator
MSDRLLALQVFARIARTGSFSRAGRDLGLSQPSASRIASELERQVGAALMTRTTRGLKLTEAGADYLARIEPILAALEEADYAARGTGELRGTLRVSLPLGLGLREVIPLLPAFMELHPALRIDLSLNDRNEDLVAEGIDVALRVGALADSNATARRLGSCPRLLVASPQYLARSGMPDTPESLANHQVIVGPIGVGLDSCTFQRNGRTTTVRVEGRLTTSVNQGAIAGAVASLGIAAVALWNCRAEIESGALVQVLPDWKMEPFEFHALFAAGRAAKPSARAFTDYLATTLRESSRSSI